MTITAADGFPLGGMRYLPTGPVRGRFVLGGATGVGQRYYRRFALYAAAKGFATLTFDYRGIGASRRSSLKGFEATYLDWGRLDLGAAVESMRSAHTALFLIGHSFGGQAVGLLPNHDALAGAYCFGVGAGWSGWMPKSEAWKVWLQWNVVLPSLVALKGYMPWSLLGMGEDLPFGVYRQWRRWCGYPHYFFDDPAMTHISDVYARVCLPLVAANAVDDPWASPKSRDAFVRAFTGADVSRLDLQPWEPGKGIGHMGYFRADAIPLWDKLLQWVEQQLADRAETGTQGFPALAGIASNDGRLVV